MWFDVDSPVGQSVNFGDTVGPFDEQDAVLFTDLVESEGEDFVRIKNAVEVSVVNWWSGRVLAYEGEGRAADTSEVIERTQEASHEGGFPGTEWSVK